VTAFAGDAFAQLERLRARIGRHVECMASETFCRSLGFAQSENPSHALADGSGERVIRFGVFVLNHPNAVFILKNSAIGTRLHATVAARGTAGAGAGVFAGIGGRIPQRRIGSAGTRRNIEKYCDGPDDSASQRPRISFGSDTHSFARMERTLGYASFRDGPRQKFLYCR